jgi:hypothetical protein
VQAEHEAVRGQEERTGHHDRLTVPDAAVRLALADPSGGVLGDRLLAAATAGQQVGQEELGVQLDDPHEQLVVAQGTGGGHHLGDEAVRGGRRRGECGVGVGDGTGRDLAPLTGHQVAQHRRHVRPGAVDRHPAHPGPAGDLCQRRTTPAHVEDAGPRGVEIGRLRTRFAIVTK